MPRPLRYPHTDLPMHVVQRGNDRQRTFLSEDDHGLYLASLYVEARKHGVEVYAYALMPNHVHLLLRPQEPGAVSRVMQSLGRRFVKFVNAKHARTGTLWEGRHKTSVIRDTRYLATCHAYIELNPVRAGIVAHPESWAWSSAAHYLGLRQDPLLTECPTYRDSASDLRGRIAAHRARLSRGLDAGTLERIRQACVSGSGLGGETITVTPPMRAHRPTGRPRGRPRLNGAAK